ncbi:MAG TPA: hypothetical protein VIL85_16830 [Thermomicrobiales bacterium]|jgi:hypothetical protein
MNDERQWIPVAVIWDEDRRKAETPAFIPPRLRLLPEDLTPSLPRPSRAVTERPERRDEPAGARRDKPRQKPRRKKLRAQDLDDEE